MPTLTENKAPDNSTDANFRAWAKFVSDGLANAGWVQTSDTGQINLSTVTRPTGNHESRGYQIWRTNDSLTPFYLKIEYGSGTNANNPAIWCTLGWGSNGSGTLTGNTTTRHQFVSSSNTTTTYPCYAAGGTSWFATTLFSQNVSGSMFAMILLIERLRSSSGAEIDNAAWIGMFGGANGAGISSTRNASQVCLNGGTNPAGIPSIPVIQGANSTFIIGSTVGMFPIVPIGQVPYPAILSAMGFYHNDIGDATTIVVPRYSVNHTYLALQLYNGGSPNFGQFSGSSSSTFSSAAPAIRWE